MQRRSLHTTTWLRLRLSLMHPLLPYARRCPAPSSQLPPGAPEFVLAQTAEPHLFVVRRQTRSAGQPPRLGVQAYYYILGNERHTYQAPSLHTLITARMRRAMACVRQGLATFKVCTLSLHALSFSFSWSWSFSLAIPPPLVSLKHTHTHTRMHTMHVAAAG
jgi:MED6 mediator sub complex component